MLIPPTPKNWTIIPSVTNPKWTFASPSAMARVPTPKILGGSSPPKKNEKNNDYDCPYSVVHIICYILENYIFMISNGYSTGFIFAEQPFVTER